MMEPVRKKHRLSNRAFRALIIPIVIVFGSTILMADYEMLSSPATMDVLYGGGKQNLIVPSGKESWNADYYASSFASLAEAKKNSESISETICEEGFVLLKNDGTLPLAKKSRVAPFGYDFVNPVYGGSGSGGTTNVENITPEAGLSSDFTLVNDIIDKMKGAKATAPEAAKGTTELHDGGVFGGLGDYLYQYDPAIYEGVEDDLGDATGIVFIGRAGGEGTDKKKDAYDDGTPHYLSLTAKEKATIAFAKTHCQSVVAIINSSNVMQLGDLEDGDSTVNAILWVGGPGANGFQAMADILCGKVNPSGRTSDIFPSDLTKDPTYVNFGDYEYSNVFSATDPTVKMHFVEYEEGVYEGYRYYETASDLGAIDYGKSVVYPFGYGLSYTTFVQTIVSFEEDESDIDITVEVTNAGEVSGKDVVQLYYSSPYTAYDIIEGVEKPTTILGTFGKTSLLAPGASETLRFSLKKEDMASYDSGHLNPDGTQGCYLLEQGNYVISLRQNSHQITASRSLYVPADVFYDSANPRASEVEAQSAQDENGAPTSVPANGASSFLSASNRFSESDYHMSDEKVTNLSRKNWIGSFPTSPTEEDERASSELINAFQPFDYETDSLLGNVKGSEVYHSEAPSSLVANGLVLSDMRGKSYYDPIWDSLLAEIDYSGEGLVEIQRLLFLGAYQTGKLTLIGKPATVDRDGPAGFSVFGSVSTKWSSWCSEVVLASSWNESLGAAMGRAIGQEGLLDGIQGWYAPAVNIHRSPFGGRNFEYYSEDSLLSGKMGAAVSSGAGEEGLRVYLKHFAMYEQETDRFTLVNWANEQTIREIYLKPFEICVKDAKSSLRYFKDGEKVLSNKTFRSVTAVMTALTFIGGKGCFESRSLLNDVLRNEWGFTGMVETDMGIPDANREDEMIRSGGDVFMALNTVKNFTVPNDCKSPTAQWCLRRALHDVAYSVVNSNLMQNVIPGATFSYDLSPWKWELMAANAFVLVFGLALIIRMVRRKEP